MSERTLNAATRARWRPAWTAMQPWRLVVFAVGAAGCVVTGFALADFAETGVVRPEILVGGLLATILVNRVYVIVARRGEVLEGIDLAEGPIVALALALPPGEALITFVAASALMEIPLDRAIVKKVFNIGVRATGAGLLMVPVLIAGWRPAPGVAQYAAVAVGAVLYTAANTLAVSTVIASVENQPVRAVLLGGTRMRLLVWAAAVTMGLSAGYAALEAPWALAGMMALLVLISVTTATSRRAQRESERLAHVLDASTRIQSSEDPLEQEANLLEVARELLLWKDVYVCAAEPMEGEQGAKLYVRDGQQRWLIASPRTDSDPWAAEDTRVLEALAGAATAAFERVSLQAELSRQALLDPLTGVANRRNFDETAKQLLADGVSEFGVVVCDLDDFKDVNDGLGHDAGDALLRITASRMAACVRDSDLVARLGGDEFAVVLPGVGSAAAVASIAEKIAERFNQPVQIGEAQLPRVASSLGYANAPDDGATVHEVLRIADAAMYVAKRQNGPDASAHDVAVPPPRSRATGTRITR